VLWHAHGPPAAPNYLSTDICFGSVLYGDRAIKDGFRPETRSGLSSQGVGVAVRAPVVRRAFVTAAIAPVQQPRFFNGSVTHMLDKDTPVGFTIASAHDLTPVAGLQTCYHDIAQIRRRLGAHLVDMQRNGHAVESDDYGGAYLKFGYASGAGTHQPAGAWILPSHDRYMDEVALVFALIPPLQRFAAECMRHAGAEPDGCEFSLLRRQVARMGLDASDHHSSPSFAIRGLVDSRPCGAHCDHDRDGPQVVN
jgi:hypothetical protein